MMFENLFAFVLLMGLGVLTALLTIPLPFGITGHLLKYGSVRVVRVCGVRVRVRVRMLKLRMSG